MDYRLLPKDGKAPVMQRNKTVLMFVTRSQIERAHQELLRKPELGGYMFPAEPIESENKTMIEKFEAVNPQLKTPETT